MTLVRPFTLFALILSLSACSSWTRSDDAAAAKREMIGLSREDVLACMGPAGKKAAEGSTEVWSYKSHDGSGSQNSISSTDNGFTIGRKDHARSFCTVSIVMKDGVVTRVNYTGPTSAFFLTPDEQCGYAVANCVGGAYK